jgi:hypothetical protein
MVGYYLFIFSYPDAILNEIFTKWVDINDFCAVDSAVSNVEQRPYFEDLIQSEAFTQYGIDTESFHNQKGFLFLKWIFRRGIKLQYIFLDVQNKEEFALLSSINLSVAKIIDLRHYEPQEGSLFPLINACVRLEELVLKNCNISDIIMYLMPRLNQLKYLNLYSYSNFLTMDAISTVSHKCFSLEKIILIFGCGNGDSQHVNVNDSLAKLVYNNNLLNYIEVDLVDERPGNNNSNLTFLKDIAGRCKNLRHCEIKYYGVLDITCLAKFISCQDIIEKLALEVTDTEEGQFCEVYYCSYNNKKILHIFEHINRNDNQFESLFYNTQFTHIKLKNIKSISDKVVSLIALHSCFSLMYITIYNCGIKWTTDSLKKLLMSCVNLECITLRKCHQINFAKIIEAFDDQHTTLPILRKLHIECAKNLFTYQLIEIAINLKRLAEIFIGDCTNIDMNEVRSYLLLNKPGVILKGD